MAVTTIEELLQGDDQFRYMMLSRFQMDCEYYLGYGNRCVNRLWTHDEKEQISHMKALYDSFQKDAKPEWCTYQQILDYEKSMVCGQESEGIKNGEH